MQTASFYHMLSVIYLLIIARTIVLVQIDFLFQFVLSHDMLLFTPFSVTRFAMHRIYANRINSHGMSRVFCDLRSQKTPRGILPVNSNVNNNPFFFSSQNTCSLSSNMVFLFCCRLLYILYNTGDSTHGWI